MIRQGMTVAIVMGLYLTPVVAQEAKDIKKSEPPVSKGNDKAASVKPGEIDVQFYNGSSVRLVILSQNLDVATRFGKLQVPVKEIRAIEFGVHLPEGAQARIDQAVKLLGSESFKEREDATKVLIELGPHSFAAVNAAARDQDAEIARRARDVAKKLQGNHAKSDLKTSLEDRIVTDGFTVVGQILTSSVKANAKYFGEVDLKLSDMRTLKAVLGASHESVVNVDALNYANAGQWLDTKFRSDGRSTLVVHAKGLVDQWPQGPGQYMVGPNGNQGPGRVMIGQGRKIPINPNPQFGGQHTSGMLIGKIGDDGEAFVIGEHFEGAVETEGTLFLHIGPSLWNCPSSGTYEVRISRKN